MDFTKFMSLLDRSELYFANVARLGDPFEGSYARRNLTGELNPDEMMPVFDRLEPGSKAIRVQPSTPRDRKSNFTMWQRLTYANCWHMNDHESAAMWSVYSRSGQGIAIQSTYERLRDSFDTPAPRNTVYIGVVKYIDYETDAIPETNSMFRFLRKRMSFEHERELRALTVGDIPKPEGGISPPVGGIPKPGTGINPLTVPTEPGKYIHVNLRTLIESVHVSPKTPDWVTELVRSTMVRMAARNEFGGEVPVINSLLDDQPLY